MIMFIIIFGQIRAYYDVLPQAARLSIYFCERKSVVLHLLEDLINDKLLRWLEEKKKSPAPGGNRTHNLESFAPQAYALLCATTAVAVKIFFIQHRDSK